MVFGNHKLKSSNLSICLSEHYFDHVPLSASMVDIIIIIIIIFIIIIIIIMTDSMGPGRLVRHMQNPSYTYDTYLICMGLGPRI